MSGPKRILSIGNGSTGLLRNAVMSAVGYCVNSPRDPKDYYQLIELDRFDLVVIGHTVPKDERIALIKQIRLRRQGLPILTLYTSPDAQDRAADCEVNALDGPEALLRTIHAYIGDPESRTVGSPEPLAFPRLHSE